MKILAYILGTLTRHNRQRVVLGRDFEWASKSWTHNVFRAYEMLFWRSVGIRREAAAAFGENGTIIRQFFTLEAVLSHLEHLLRSKLAFKIVRVYVPAFSPVGGLPISSVPYLFAIAYDNSAASTAGTDTGKTLSFTQSGSNTLLLTHAGAVASTTGFTWNASAMTQIGTTQVTDVGEDFNLWAFVGGSGTQNIVSTCSGSTFNCFVATSYSGVNQSVTPDSTNSGTSAASQSSYTLATTVVASNCWTFEAVGSSNLAPTNGTNATLRLVGTNIFISAFDSNGTVGTGSISMTVNGGGGVTQFTMTTASFAPVGVATSGKNFLVKQAVNRASTY